MPYADGYRQQPKCDAQFTTGKCVDFDKQDVSLISRMQKATKITRIKSALHDLMRRSDPIYRWRLSKGLCPVCGPSSFILLGPNAIMTRCLSCKATTESLSLISVAKEYLENNPDASAAYELSTYGIMVRWLQQKMQSVTTSEYIPDQPFGQTIDGVLNQDVQALTFPDGSFDILTSTHVFEHVENDIQGFKECYRVLKPGGIMIFNVPLHDLPATQRKAYTENGRIIFIGEPEYHGSRISGPNSVPVFWHHSFRDICNRLEQAGFDKTSLRKIFIAPADKNPALVVCAFK